MQSHCCVTKNKKNDLKVVVDFLKALSEENRLRILCLLRQGDLCVCEIWQYLDLSQNLTSHHLKVLKDFKLVKSKNQGTKIIYSLNTEELRKHLSLLSHFIDC